MSKHKSSGKDKKKGSQLVIRIDKAERDAFVTLCDQLDSSAAREIRRFMRDLVASHSGANPAPSVEPENILIPDENDDSAAVGDIPEPPTADVDVETVAVKTVRARKKRAPQ